MGKINYFDDIKIGNEIFSLSHLNPKYLEFYGQKVQKTLKLKVLYSDHCFTARVNRSVSDSERVFSIERYNLSKLLPNIIEGLNNDKIQVFQTLARRNFAYVVKTTLNDKDYNIFFEVKKVTTASHVSTRLFSFSALYFFTLINFLAKYQKSNLS
ncbi:hypothetical protein JQS65_20815 [Yersinia enterocolitica subsp. palearctica]|nr:hypothetical protein [Yersinia enterocolitica subsp. palearctica]